MLIKFRKIKEIKINNENKKRNYLELTTKCNNLANIRTQLIEKKALYGNKFRNSQNQQGIASTLRSTGLSGFSPLSSYSPNKFN